MSEVYTGEGLVTIKNPGNSKIEIEISGNEKQKTREGYNKLENHLQSQTINGVNIVINSDKSITLNGTATAFFQLILLDTDDTPIILSPKTYTMSLKGKILGINFVGTENGVDVPYLASTVTTESVQKTYQSETTITKILCAISQGTQLNNVKLYPMIYEGTDEKEYEEYGAMPSFDYPSEIEAVGDNKNIFDDSYYKGFVVTQQNYNALEKIDLKLEANKYYVAKIYFEDGTSVSTNNSNFMLYGYKADGTQSANIPNGVAKTYANATELVKAKLVANSTGLSTYANKTIKGIKIEEVANADGQPTAYSNYGQGCIELNIINKNVLDVPKNSTVTKAGMTITTDTDGVLTFNGTTESDTYIQLNNGFTTETKYWTKKHFKANSYVFSCENLFNNQDLNANAYVRENAFSNTVYATLARVFNQKSKNVKFNLAENVDAVVYLWIQKGITLNNAKLKFQIELADTATDIVANEEQEYVIPVQQRMFKQDKFIKINGSWKEMHTMGTVYSKDVSSINIKTATAISPTKDGFYRYNINLGQLGRKTGTYIRVSSNYFKYGDSRWANEEGICGWETGQQLSLGTYDKNYDTADKVKTFLEENNVEFNYKLAKPIYLDCTPEQINILNQIENIELYEGINNITATSSIDPNLQVTVKKLVEDYNIYISEKGHLMIPEYNIDYLIDTNESNIPIMPEATESSVRAAGRDGDIVLNTTYEPIPFDIVCYTEDNLTQTEKLNAEKNINKFLNSIKNKTINIAFENNNTFYKVKYSGALVTTNYPKHLKFAIPLKSSDSYGKDLIPKSIVGNNTEESDTIEDVGALFIIRGPALNPIISLNDYSMEYTTSILEGASVEIDTSKSTITNVNNDGIRTNVMKYYNHQFPKIQNGINTLKILSGIDNDKNVIVTWNDLKL